MPQWSPPAYSNKYMTNALKSIMSIYGQRNIHDKEMARVFNIIEENKNVPFVDRIRNKDKYPSLKEKGYDVTHKMAWGQIGNRYIVFPTVEIVDDKLVDLDKLGINPAEYALINKNYIEFDNPDDADWFSKNYKKYWKIRRK